MIPITPIQVDVGEFRRQQSVGLGRGGRGQPRAMVEQVGGASARDRARAAADEIAAALP